MIHIKYDVKTSEQDNIGQDNIGFFADQPIEKGAIIYSPSTGYSSDDYINGEAYDTLDRVWRLALQHWGEPDDESESDGWFRKFDFTRCAKTSDNPTMIEGKDQQLIAARNIKAGEELTRSR